MRIKSQEAITDEKSRATIISEIVNSVDAVKRKDEHLKRSEVYNDRTRVYAVEALKDEMGKSTAAEMLHRTPNLSITKLIVKKKARVYKDRPLRKTKTKKQSKILDAFVDYIKLDDFMKRVNRRVELHLNILVKCLPVKCEESKYGVDLDIITPTNFDVIPDPEQPTKPMVVILSYPRHEVLFMEDYRTGVAEQTSISKGRAGEDKTKKIDTKENVYIWWSEKYNFTTDEKGKILKKDSKLPDAEAMANDFKVLPFVSFAKGQEGYFWVDGGEGQADNAILINLLLADLNYSAKYQSTGIGWIRGKAVPESVTMGASRFIKMSYDEGEPIPEIGFASPSPKLNENMDLIEQQLAFFLTSEGLEPGAIKGKLEAGNANSGVQEIIQKSEPSTSIEDDQQLYKDQEPEIVELAAEIIQVLNERNVLDDDLKELTALTPEFEYILTFPKPKAYANEKDQIETAQLKQASGLYTIEDIIQDLHPDWGQEEVTAYIIKLDAEAKKKAELAKAALVPEDPNDGPDDKKPKLDDEGNPIQAEVDDAMEEEEEPKKPKAKVKKNADK